MDTGGLAQMTYNRSFASDTLSIPPGYGARDRSAQFKRLSMSGMNMDGGDDRSPASAGPRTSRGHLLAGLRTAPKPNSPSIASAPHSKVEFGLESSRFANASPQDRNQPLLGATTKPSFNFPQAQYGNRFQYNGQEQHYNSPPQIQINGDNGDEFDPNVYAQLMKTKMLLAERQRQLDEQWANVQAQYAAQQMQGLRLNGMNNFQSYGTPPLTPSMMQMYNSQPMMTAVPGSQPNLYSVVNPANGQQYYVDAHAQQSSQQNGHYAPVQSPTIQTDYGKTSRFGNQISSPTTYSPNSQRTLSPPGLSGSPTHAQSLASNSSALAYRRGHKKVSSLSSSLSHVPEHVESGPKTSVPRTVGFPATPMTGTFAPGHNRSGEHPSRQPRGPPAIEELIAKPTAKHEGSKNFATRQRRRAVNSLVRAGMERRTARGSNGSMSPLSESENPLFASDNDSVGSGRSVSSKRSIGSLRAARAGAIGSERKSQSVERASLDESAVVSGDEGKIGGV